MWNVICIQLELVNVSTELLVAHSSPQTCFQEVSLASIDFLQSKLVYESYSDGMKDIDLVSHEIRASDTRYRGVYIFTINAASRLASSCLLYSTWSATNSAVF